MKTKTAVKAVRVRTKDIVLAAKFVGPFADKTNTLPILKNILLEVAGGRLILTATNLEIGAVTSIPIEAAEPFAIAVPARKFAHYLRAIHDSEIHLSVDRYALKVEHGSSVALISGMTKDSFPELPVPPAESIKLAGLRVAIPRIMTSISTEESRFTLNGALLDIRESGCRFASCDGHRLSSVDIQATGNFRAVVPHDALHRLSKLEVDEAELSHHEDHLFFRFGTRLVIARKLTGDFPDAEKLLRREPTSTLSISSENLNAAGSRAVVFSDEMPRMVTLDFSADMESIICNSNSEWGKATAACPCELDGNPIKIAFNWKFVSDFLSLAPGPITVGLISEKDQALFSAPGWKYILMPMRI